MGEKQHACVLCVSLFPIHFFHYFFSFVFGPGCFQKQLVFVMLLYLLFFRPLERREELLSIALGCFIFY